MENFLEPEGQTTSDNLTVSETEKDCLKPESVWGEISEEEESYLSKKGLKSPAELLKSYRELEKAYSHKISLPKDGDKEALNKLYSRLGMPDNTENFALTLKTEDQPMSEAFKQVCLENHILPQSAQALYDWFYRFRAVETEQAEAQRLKNSLAEAEAVQREWGNDRLKNQELMKRGIRLFTEGDDDLVDAMEQSLGTRQMMQVFYHLGEAISEDNPVSFGAARSEPEWNASEYFREMFMK
jgi:hypothetical protein